jgi:hypothetical protein
MRSSIRSLWVPVVCAVVLSGAPGVAVAHEANPSSESSGTTPSLMAMITPGAVLVTRAVACNSADQYTQCISLSPSQGQAGAQVTVNGTGWIDHANRGLDVPINIGMTEVARAHPNADGTFNVGLTIPTSTPEGESEIDAIIGNGGSASARYTITGQTSPPTTCPSPSVYFSRTSGPIDTKVTITGNRWAPGGAVSITLPYGSQGRFSGPNMTPQVSSGSDWQTEMTVDRTPPGEYVINLEEHTSECSLKLSPTFTVTASTSYPDPNTVTCQDQVKDGQTVITCTGPVPTPVPTPTPSTDSMDPEKVQRDLVTLVTGPVSCFFFDAAEAGTPAHPEKALNAGIRCIIKEVLIDRVIKEKALSAVKAGILR